MDYNNNTNDKNIIVSDKEDIKEDNEYNININKNYEENSIKENNNNINESNNEDNNISEQNDKDNKYSDNNINEDNYDNKRDLISKNTEDEQEINNKKNSKNKISDNKNSYKKLEPSYLRIKTKNKKDIDMTKSAILNLFSTKSLRKQDSDYEDSKVNKEEINSPFKNIKEEKDSDDNKSEGSFINLLSKINDLDYQGYNYKLKKEDFFKRVPDEPPIETILNSEDAAIKKCEELMNQLENELKWEDPDFGPQPNDNGSGSKKAIYGEYGNAENIGINVNNISWYGIKEINENATFFYDGAESNDVMQGALGDCWFISALSVIATKDYLLRGEFNKSIYNSNRIFSFQFLLNLMIFIFYNDKTFE